MRVCAWQRVRSKTCTFCLSHPCWPTPTHLPVDHRIHGEAPAKAQQAVLVVYVGHSTCLQQYAMVHAAKTVVSGVKVDAKLQRAGGAACAHGLISYCRLPCSLVGHEDTMRLALFGSMTWPLPVAIANCSAASTCATHAGLALTLEGKDGCAPHLAIGGQADLHMVPDLEAGLDVGSEHQVCGHGDGSQCTCSSPAGLPHLHIGVGQLQGGSRHHAR
jgi:hypothetical protein